MMRKVFPFVAVIGQERVKKALILSVINPRIGGVLISGEKGTAKTTLVRSLTDVIDDISIIDLPLNITEDRLVGSIDIESAIIQGRKDFEPGLLQKSDGNILYVDEVNLLSEHIANCLLEVAASGINIIEREGISHQHAACFVMVGTMNPEEGLLRPQLLDRFGLFTEVHGEHDSQKRAEIIRRRLAYEQSPSTYQNQWREESQILKGRIEKARKALPFVQVKPNSLSLAASLATQAGCAGHRAEIIIMETARAIAAFEGRTEIIDDDIREAAGFALPHRIREAIPICDNKPGNELEEEANKSIQKNNLSDNTSGNTPQKMKDFDLNYPSSNETTEAPQGGQIDRQQLESPRDMPAILLEDIQLNGMVKPQGSGKRIKVKSDFRQGRYIRYRLPRGKVRDLAFDATLRAAAPFQKRRKEEGLAVVIKSSDIREKVKEKHTGCVVLFVIDASGSMGARRRMGAVKGAVISILGDVYRKRDRVGVVAFRKDSATTLLGITRSIDLAHKCLKELPTGGRTPLASGLAKAYELLKTAKIKEPDILPYLVLVSDGKANNAFNSDDAFGDAVRVAIKIRQEGIKCMVFDTEDGYIRLGLAKKIAEVLNANYVKMSDISADNIKLKVKQLVN